MFVWYIKRLVIFVVVVVSFLKTLSVHAYRGEVERLAGWCSENDLELNVSKTKDIVFDLRNKETPLVPLTIAGEVVEEVKAMFLCFLLLLFFAQSFPVI